VDYVLSQRGSSDDKPKLGISSGTPSKLAVAGVQNA
jgi:hypothetical protein